MSSIAGHREPGLQSRRSLVPLLSPGPQYIRRGFPVKQHLALCLVCCLTPLGGPRAQANSSGGQPTDAKQQLLKLESEWVNAEVKHDEATLRRILDDKFLASFDSSEPYDKESFIKIILSGDVDPTESQTLTNQDVIVDHDTAVVVGIDTERKTENGTQHETVYRYTVTYIYRDGRWLALAEHLVQVPKLK